MYHSITKITITVLIGLYCLHGYNTRIGLKSILYIHIGKLNTYIEKDRVGIPNMGRWQPNWRDTEPVLVRFVPIEMNPYE